MQRIGQVIVFSLVLLIFVAVAPAQKWAQEFHTPRSTDVIGFALYTVQDRVMKMTVQLYPLTDEVDRAVKLQVRRGGAWAEIASTKVSEESMGHPQEDLKRWTANFRVEEWDQTKNHAYRVLAAGGQSTYEGTIRRDPIDKKQIVVAAFTGNSSHDRRLKPDIIANIKAQDPDLLFFSGDQSYDHKFHFQAWLLFGKQFGEIIKDRPTICLPDDHDVGQANIWGENGVDERTGEAGAEGGYFWSPQYVNSVQLAQTWHLPDAYDPAPIKRDIGVYYTDLKIGRLDFAIVEDRKFKTGPAGLIPPMGPRPDHITDPAYDRKAVDLPEARLLGERQLKFLRDWGAQWEGVDMKAVLSQTVFANAAHRGRSGVQRLASGRSRSRADRDPQILQLHDRRRPAPGDRDPSRHQQLRRQRLLLLRAVDRQLLQPLVGPRRRARPQTRWPAAQTRRLLRRLRQQADHVRLRQSR
jgi:hypothetical protein